MKNVIILYGALRSGTTMMRLMLASHPMLSSTGETDFLFDHLQQDGETWRYDQHGLLLDRVYRASQITCPPDLDGKAALERMIEQIQRNPKAHPVLVLHRHATKALALLPHAKVIHLLRDPRDVARSVIGMGWAGNVYHGLSPWMETEAEWGKAKAQHRLDVHEVRFESLVSAPEDTLKALCRFLDLDYDPAMLNYDAGSTYEKPNTRLATQWLSRLSSREIRLIESRLGQRLEGTGYSNSGLPPLKISSFEIFYLTLQNYFFVKAYSIRRYGLLNLTIRKIAHVFNIKSLEVSIQHKIDEVSERWLK